MYSDPSHALAYALECASLRRKKRLWRSGDATKCRQRATCNRGQYRLRKPNTPLGKEVERETGDPEGNLVIVEKCACREAIRLPEAEG